MSITWLVPVGSHVFQRGFLRGQQHLSFSPTSWEIFLVSCCFQTGLCIICWTLLLRLPLGWKDLSSISSPQIFQMALISMLAMEIHVNECCCADERSKNANECSDALRLLHLHCWPFLQLFFKHTLLFLESRVQTTSGTPAPVREIPM